MTYPVEDEVYYEVLLVLNKRRSVEGHFQLILPAAKQTPDLSQSGKAESTVRSVRMFDREISAAFATSADTHRVTLPCKSSAAIAFARSLLASALLSTQLGRFDTLLTLPLCGMYEFQEPSTDHGHLLSGQMDCQDRIWMNKDQLELGRGSRRVGEAR